VSAGLCAFFYDWDWGAAERAFRRGLEINPDNVFAHMWYSALLSAIGRREEAIHAARRAVETDPLSVNAAAHLAWVLHFDRRY